MKQELKTPDNRFELLKDRLKTRFFDFMLVSLLVGLFIHHSLLVQKKTTYLFH